MAAFLPALVFLAALSRAEPLDDARAAQARGKTRQSAFTSAQELAAAKTRDLRRVLEGVVGGLEKEGVSFEKVQGDSYWNPLPEAVPSKVAIEKRSKTPQVIMLPSGGERIYAGVTRRKGGWLVTLESRGKKKTIAAPEKLDSVAPRLREALLDFIRAG